MSATCQECKHRRLSTGGGWHWWTDGYGFVQSTFQPNGEHSTRCAKAIREAHRGTIATFQGEQEPPTPPWCPGRETGY